VEVASDDMNDVAWFDVEVFNERGDSANTTLLDGKMVFPGLHVTQFTERKISFFVYNLTVPTKEQDYKNYYTIRVYLYDKFNNQKSTARIQDIFITVIKN